MIVLPQHQTGQQPTFALLAMRAAALALGHEFRHLQRQVDRFPLLRNPTSAHHPQKRDDRFVEAALFK